MSRLFSTTAAILILTGAAYAQETGGTAATTTDLSMGSTMGADLSMLPEACRSWAGGSLSGTTTGASDSAGTAATGDATAGSADAAPDSADPAASTDGTGTETATAPTDTTTGSTASGGATGGSGGLSTAISTMHGQMMAVQGLQGDLAFACAMIPHHQGAIDMARAMEAQLQDEELKSMAQTMITSQQAEIDTLTAWIEANGTAGQ